MTKRLVRILNVFMAVALVVVLAGCGHTAAKAQHQRVTITFWHAMSASYQGELNNLIKQFNATQSKYKVVATYQGDYGNLQQKITAAAKAGNLPVIAQSIYTSVPDYEKDGLLQPLDQYADGKNGLSAADKRDIYPVFLARSKYRGHTYSLPFSRSNQIMFYNRKLLRANGLQVPKTWSQLQQLGTALAGKHVAAVAFDQSFDVQLNQLAAQYGTPLISKRGQVQVDSPAAVRAAKLLTGMLAKQTALSAGADGYGNKLFFSGKAATYMGSSAAISLFKQLAPKDFDWATAPMPTANGKQASTIAGNDLVMFRGASAAQKRGANLFMKFVMSKQATSAWARGTGYLPLRKSVVNSASYKRYLQRNPQMQPAVNEISSGIQDHTFVGYTAYHDDLLKSVDAMTNKHEQPAAALKRLQQQVQTDLKQ